MLITLPVDAAAKTTVSSLTTVIGASMLTRDGKAEERYWSVEADIPSLSRAISRLFLVIVIVLLAASSAFATITVTPMVDASSAIEIKSAQPDIRYGLRLTNNSAVQVELNIIARVTVSGSTTCPSAPSCTLGWKFDGRPLPVDQAHAVRLDPDKTVTLTYEGRAEGLGVYQSYVDFRWREESTDKSGQQRIRLTRVLADLGANAIVVGPVGRRTQDPLGLTATVPVSIANRSTDPATLAGARARLLRDAGGTYDTSVHDAALDCPSGLTIAPGERRDCVYRLPRFIAPGRYRLSVTPNGAGLADMNSTADLTVRLSWLYALLLLLIGGWGGKLLADYQNHGRRRALQTAAALRHRSTAQQMLRDPKLAAASDSHGILSEIVAELETLLNDLAMTRTADHAVRLETLEKRLDAIALFAALEVRYRALTPPAAKDEYTAARKAMAADALPTDVADKIDRLETAIAAAEAPNRRIGPTDAAQRFFGDWKSSSPVQILAAVQRLDDFIVYLSIVLAALVGVVTLWQSNPAWGSLGDILVALFTGAAGTVTGALGIRELVSTYRLGTISPRQ